MTADIVHQETNDEQRHEKRHSAAEEQDSQLERRKIKAELNELKPAETEHYRHGKKKGKLSRSHTRYADYQRAYDSRTGAGGAGIIEST